MNNMHSDPPGAFTATQVVALIGGPYDGEDWNVPADCHALTGSSPHDSYRYCPHASARFGKACFIQADLQHDLYAR